MQIGSSPYQSVVNLPTAESAGRAKVPDKVEAQPPRPTAPDSAEIATAALSSGAASLLAPGAVITMQATDAADEPPGSEVAGTRRDPSSAMEDDGSRVADREGRRGQREREAAEVRTAVEPARARDAAEAYRVAAYGNQTEAAAATSRPDIRDLSV